MHISAYRGVLMVSPERFRPNELYPMLNKIYSRVNRRPAEARDWDYRPAPHLQKIKDELAAVGPHVVEAAISLLDSRHNPSILRDRQQLVVLLWALGNMKRPKATEAIAPYVRDESAKIRMAAISALRDICDPRAVADLLFHQKLGPTQNPTIYYGYYSGSKLFAEGEEEILALAIKGLKAEHPEAFQPFYGGYYAIDPQENLLSQYHRPLLLDESSFPRFLDHLRNTGLAASKEYLFDRVNRKLVILEHYAPNVHQQAERLYPGGFQKENYSDGGLYFKPGPGRIEASIGANGGSSAPADTMPEYIPVRDHLAQLLEEMGAVVSPLSPYSHRGPALGKSYFTFTIQLPPQF